ncbi:MAG: PAS domain S-box protein [Chloroflexi bacterium]|nr:PAS domain S-box protein [Chloroflexota bacterium]
MQRKNTKHVKKPGEQPHPAGGVRIGAEAAWVVEEIADAVMITTDSGLISYVNGAFEQLTGYSKGETTGNTWRQVGNVSEDDFRRAQRSVLDCLQKGSNSDVELTITNKDGREIPVIISHSSLKTAEGESLVIGVARDMSERRRMDQALRESEAKYRAVVEQSHDAVAIVQDGVFRFANRAMVAVFGYSLEELLGKAFTELIAPESREMILERYRLRMAGGHPPAIYELKTVHKNGNIIDAELSAGVVEYQGKPADITSLRDITKRKRAEEAARQSEAKLRAVIDSSPDAITVTDLNGCIIDSNQATLALHGFTAKEQLVGRNAFDLIAPRDRQRAAEALETTLSLGALRDAEYVFLTRDGQEFPAELSASVVRDSEGKPTSFMAITKGIADRKRMEKALHASEAWFRAVYEQSPIAIELCDSSGLTVGRNKACCELFGLPDDATHRTESPHDDTETPLQTLLMNTLVAPDTVREGLGQGQTVRWGTAIDFDRLRKHGRYHGTRSGVAQLDLQVTPLGIERQGSANGYSIQIQDVTERTQAEQRRSEAYEKESALRAELEMEMKRRAEFLRALVHELKTPITSVMASGELLAVELPEGPLLSAANNLYRSAENLNRRIDELLDLARGELGMLRLNTTSVMPVELLREIFGEMAAVVKAHGQTLVLDVPASLPIIRADKDRLRQVLLNLLSNASKFTGEGGTITVRARQADADLVVEVKDTGPGIDKAEQPRLFHAYERLMGDSQQFSGLGLGLALSKALVELHGGQIWVKSEKGKGSTFGFSIPLRR